MGDLSVNLKPKGERARVSHAIALDIRKRLASVPLPPHSSIKVVEVAARAAGALDAARRNLRA